MPTPGVNGPKELTKFVISMSNGIRLVCRSIIITHLTHHVYHSEKFIDEREDKSSGDEILFPRFP